MTIDRRAEVEVSMSQHWNLAVRSTLMLDFVLERRNDDVLLVNLLELESVLVTTRATEKVMLIVVSDLVGMVIYLD